MRKKLTFGRMLLALIMLAILFAILHPFLWLLISTFKHEREILTYPPKFFASDYTLMNYVEVWKSIPVLSYIKNTVIFAVGACLFSALFDSMAGYAFARMQFKGRALLFTGVLVTMMIPYQVVIVPLFVEVHFFGLLDTYWGLILPRAATPFGIFLMRSFFVSLPKELEESGRVDGINELRIFTRIMLPLCIPAVVTHLIFHLMHNWNDLLYPLMLTSSSNMRTLSSGLAFFVGETIAIKYTLALSAAAISMIPLLIVYVFAQRFFVQGVATSGLKG